MKEKLIKAELRIFKMSNPKQRSLSSYFLIIVADIISKKTICAGITASTSHGWHVFPLTNVVKTWIFDNSKNKGIHISIRSLYGNNDKVKFATKQTIRREPILVIHTKNHDEITLTSIPDFHFNKTLLMSSLNKQSKTSKTRRRRAVNDPCHLEPLEVPIQEIGWNINIMKPQVFTINHCKGRCWHDSSKVYQQQTNHAIIQALYAAVTQEEKTSYPCCAPAEFQPGSALIISSRNVKLLILEKLTVTSCECM